MAPFLTELDHEARLRGSRDPLGIQSIWIGFGRYIIGNLTNASNDIRGFTTLLLGLYFIERGEALKAKLSPLSIFIKWEQLAAYARCYINKDENFRGIERVKARDRENLVISDSAQVQILSDQKVYGIWGLYRNPAQNSDLIQPNSVRLTLGAREFIENVYVRMFNEKGFKNGDEIARLLIYNKSDNIDAKGKHRKILKVIADVLSLKLSEEEKNYYRKNIIYGGAHDIKEHGTHGQQAILTGLLKPSLKSDNFKLSPSFILNLIKNAEKIKDGAPLAGRLRNIYTCEAVIAPSSVLFDYLLSCHDMKLSKIAENVAAEWGRGILAIDLKAFRDLNSDIGKFSDKEMADKWQEAAEALSTGNYCAAIKTLIDINTQTMRRRSAGPWVKEQNKRIDVRYNDQAERLIGKKDLAQIWKFPYFIGSLQAIAKQSE